MTDQPVEAAFTVEAEIDVCFVHARSGKGEHAPHLRLSLWSPQRRLWCLGYYDQRRQLHDVTVRVDPDGSETLVREGGNPWERTQPAVASP